MDPPIVRKSLPLVWFFPQERILHASFDVPGLVHSRGHEPQS